MTVTSDPRVTARALCTPTVAAALRAAAGAAAALRAAAGAAAALRAAAGVAAALRAAAGVAAALDAAVVATALHAAAGAAAALDAWSWLCLPWLLKVINFIITKQEHASAACYSKENKNIETRWIEEVSMNSRCEYGVPDTIQYTS
jgi:hypothetical protein